MSWFQFFTGTDHDKLYTIVNDSNDCDGDDDDDDDGVSVDDSRSDGVGGRNYKGHLPHTKYSNTIRQHNHLKVYQFGHHRIIKSQPYQSSTSSSSSFGNDWDGANGSI